MAQSAANTLISEQTRSRLKPAVECIKFSKLSLKELLHLGLTGIKLFYFL